MIGNFLSVYLKLDTYMAYRYVFSAFAMFVWANDGNQRGFIMSMLLQHGQSVEWKWREAKTAKNFIRNMSGLMSNDEM